MRATLAYIVACVAMMGAAGVYAAPKEKDGGPSIRVSSVADSYVGVRHVPEGDGPVATDAAKTQNAKASWSMQIGDGLVRQTLARWASVAGWQFEWDVPYDFPVTLEADIRGTFEDAVEAVMKSLLTSERPVQAIMYAENRTLRIVPYHGNPHLGSN